MRKLPLVLGSMGPAAALAVALGACAAGCSGGSAAAGDGGANDDGAAAGLRAACLAPDPGELDFIDNMEDGNQSVLMRGGRLGDWYTYNDGTDGTITPAEGATFQMEPIADPRCGTSRRAMRVTGSGYMGWGAGFGVAMKAGMVNGVWMGLPYDATGARGVTFWARSGETSTRSIRVMVSDHYSQPVGGFCDPTIENGPTACYDHFGAVAELTTTWQRFTFQFAEMEQRQFGLPRPGLDVTAVTSWEFLIPQASSVFDIWIDDIAFVR